MPNQRKCRNFEDWIDIINFIIRTGELYSKVNNLVSLGLADKLREIGVKYIIGVNILDAGSGPGDSTAKILLSISRSYVICLDASFILSLRCITKLKELSNRFDIVVGLFENPPIRVSSIDSIYSSYSIRDSINLLKAVYMLSRLIRKGGCFIDIDIGKPDNPIIQLLLKLYIKYAVPIISSIHTGSAKNPWVKLADTITRIPENKILFKIFSKIFRTTYLYSLFKGSLIMIVACK